MRCDSSILIHEVESGRMAVSPNSKSTRFPTVPWRYCIHQDLCILKLRILKDILFRFVKYEDNNNKINSILTRSLVLEAALAPYQWTLEMHEVSGLVVTMVFCGQASHWSRAIKSGHFAIGS